jgi:hypothetical protein
MRRLRYEVTEVITLLGRCQSLLPYSGRSACPEFRTVYGNLKFIVRPLLATIEFYREAFE